MYITRMKVHEVHGSPSHPYEVHHSFSNVCFRKWPFRSTTSDVPCCPASAGECNSILSVTICWLAARRPVR
jgi:hypothetical protein